MICIYCKGNLRSKKVEEEIKVGKDHVLVQITAEICEHCHERYFSDSALGKMLELKQKLKKDKKHFKAVGKVFRAA